VQSSATKSSAHALTAFPNVLSPANAARKWLPGSGCLEKAGARLSGDLLEETSIRGFRETCWKIRFIRDLEDLHFLSWEFIRVREKVRGGGITRICTVTSVSAIWVKLSLFVLQLS
jgi:hypothetical protein